MSTAVLYHEPPAAREDFADVLLAHSSLMSDEATETMSIQQSREYSLIIQEWLSSEPEFDPLPQTQPEPIVNIHGQAITYGEAADRLAVYLYSHLDLHGTQIRQLCEWSLLEVSAH